MLEPVGGISGKSLSDAEKQEGDERLYGSFHLFWSNFVAIHIGGGIKERVGKTVHEDSDESATIVDLREQEVTNAPSGETKSDGPFEADFGDGEGERSHEDNFRVLVVDAL